MGIRRWTTKVRRFWGLTLADKWLLLSAIYWLAIARIWLAKVLFSDLAERLSASGSGEEADPELLRRVGYAVAAAGGSVPWRSDCFPQAIAGNRLLHRYGYPSTIHLGVDKADADQLLAHAWLTCGETVITGGAEADRYVEIHRLGD